jgi:hypothetical protein
MGTQKRPTTEAPKKPACEKCGRTNKGTRKKKAAALVDQVLSKIEEQIEAQTLKPTVGDYLRLLQYREEMQEGEVPREIKVTWVEPGTAESERGE